MERVSEAYLPIEIKFLHNQDTLLGYSCIKYEMLQLDFYTQAPLKSYVWIAEGISVKNLPLLGRIFGYQNSLIKDGSLNGLALRYESEGTLNSDALVIQATEVNPIILEKSAFEVPPMYLRE
jgi:hypothetical protein